MAGLFTEENGTEQCIKTGNSDTVNYRGQWEKYRAMGVSGIYSDAL